MTQRTLFDGPLLTAPVVHADDPSTSAEAAAEHTRSGRRDRHGRIVLGLVARYPGRTAIEIWQLATADEKRELKEPQEVRRRCCDLLQAGLIVQGPRRVCTVRGTGMVVWRVVESA